MIPQNFIQDIIARIDIVELIQRYVPLKKAGANYSACCPFHKEKSPSFTVSPTKQFYHCFGCGAHGTAIGFLMEYEALGFVEAVSELAQQLGLQVPDEGPAFSGPSVVQQRSLIELMSSAARFYREQLKKSPRAIEYLKKRGLTGEIAARFGIGYAPDDWQALQTVFPHYDDPALLEAGLIITNDAGRRYDRFRDRIMFPILDVRGNVIAFGGRILDKGEPKYLNSPETPLFEKGRELYGLPQARLGIRETDSVIVVEGYMDVVALAQFGIGYAVATLGTATTATHVQKLLRQADQLIFCFDGDAAGRKAARRALDASLEHLDDAKTVRFLFLPAEHDPDSYVREFGNAAFEQAAKSATPLGRFLLDTLAQDCDLTTAEGRAHVVHTAKDYIPRIGAPVLRMQLVHELAQAAQLTPAETAQALGLKPPAKASYGQSQRPAPASAPRTAVPTPLRKLLRILLARPELGLRIPLHLIDTLPESPERNALIALIDANEDEHLAEAPLGVWIERFRNTPHETPINQALLSIEAGFLADESIDRYFDDTLRELELDRVVIEIEQISKTSTPHRDEAEKARLLRDLLDRKQKLKSGQSVQ